MSNRSESTNTDNVNAVKAILFPNQYATASYALRAIIDTTCKAHDLKSADVLGVLSVTGRNSVGVSVTSTVVLDSQTFNAAAFAGIVDSLESLDTFILLVRNETVFPPVAALELILQHNANCDVLRVCAKNLTFEFRSISKLILLAREQANRCSTCSKGRDCAVAKLIADARSATAAVTSSIVRNSGQLVLLA